MNLIHRMTTLGVTNWFGDTLGNAYIEMSRMQKKCLSAIYSNRYKKVPKWIDANFNRHVPRSSWPLLIVWYVLLTYMLTQHIVSDIQSNRFTDITIFNSISLDDYPKTFCSSVNECIDAYKQNLYSSFLGMPLKSISTSGYHASSLLDDLGLSSTQFTLDQLKRYSEMYMYCFQSPMCDVQRKASWFYVNLEKTFGDKSFYIDVQNNVEWISVFK